MSYFVLCVSSPCLVGLAAEINKSNQIKSVHIILSCLLSQLVRFRKS